ncbi:MAG: LysE family translocator [Arenicella sp.]
MIDQSTFATYLLILLGFVFIPGPAVLLTLARASASGTRAGIATALGIALGDVVHTVMAIIGISAIIMASAFLFSLIKYMGAIYLVYLGLRALLEKVECSNCSVGAPIKPSAAFRQAVLAEVLNPKSALFFLAFLPQFVKPENGSVSLQLLVLGVLFVFVGLLSTIIVAIGAGNIGSLLRSKPVIQRWQGKFVGAIYCSLGVRLAIQEK